MSDFTPATSTVRALFLEAAAGEFIPEDFDRWLDLKLEKVWDTAYQEGAFDTLRSPRDATENPYRAKRLAREV